MKIQQACNTAAILVLSFGQIYSALHKAAVWEHIEAIEKSLVRLKDNQAEVVKAVNEGRRLVEEGGE